MTEPNHPAHGNGSSPPDTATRANRSSTPPRDPSGAVGGDGLPSVVVTATQLARDPAGVRASAQAHGSVLVTRRGRPAAVIVTDPSVVGEATDWSDPNAQVGARALNRSGAVTEVLDAVADGACRVLTARNRPTAAVVSPEDFERRLRARLGAAFAGVTVPAADRLVDEADEPPPA